MRHLLTLLAVILATPALAADRYHARFADDLGAVTVRACFEAPAPPRLHRHRRAAEFTDWVRLGDRTLDVAEGSHRFRVPTPAAGECLSWRVDLDRAVAGRDYRLGMRVGDDLLMSPALWLWRASGERTPEIEVELPEGAALSSPWTEIEADRVYRPVDTPGAWLSRVAVGRFEMRRLPVPGGDVRLAVLGDVDTRRADAFAGWVAGTAGAVAEVAGYLPGGAPQVLVVPIGPRREAVPWARVVRGGGRTVEFFVDETRPITEFEADWTATHEFSHFLLPFVSRRDRWLSEGMASYYQNVIRARAGALTEREAWQKLHEGFGRGVRDAADASLADAARGRRLPTMQTYWSGAALMLMADARLRAASGGAQSLDTALAAFAACCTEPRRVWRAREVFARLDELTQTTVFSDLYERYADQPGFPEVAPVYAALGLVDDGRRVRLSEAAPWAGVRAAIMKGGAAPIPAAGAP